MSYDILSTDPESLAQETLADTYDELHAAASFNYGTRLRGQNQAFVDPIHGPVEFHGATIHGINLNGKNISLILASHDQPDAHYHGVSLLWYTDTEINNVYLWASEPGQSPTRLITGNIGQIDKQNGQPVELQHTEATQLFAEAQDILKALAPVTVPVLS